MLESILLILSLLAQAKYCMTFMGNHFDISLCNLQLFVGGLMSYLRYLCLFVHSDFCSGKVSHMHRRMC
jgi:hypothetical protein